MQNGDKKDLYPDFEYDKKPRLGPNFKNWIMKDCAGFSESTSVDMYEENRIR